MQIHCHDDYTFLSFNRIVGSVALLCNERMDKHHLGLTNDGNQSRFKSRADPGIGVQFRPWNTSGKTFLKIRSSNPIDDLVSNIGDGIVVISNIHGTKIPCRGVNGINIAFRFIIISARALDDAFFNI